MNNKTVSLWAGLAFGAALTITGPLWAGDPAKEFTVDGKPVPKIVAIVNGSPLPREFLQRELTVVRLMSSRQGREIPREAETKIARDLLTKEIDLELVYQKAREMNMQVAPETLDREFKNIRDQFPSELLFLAALKMQSLDPDSLRVKIERQLMAENFMRREIVPKVHVEESSVDAFYKNNIKSFVKPELFQISHIFIARLDPVTLGKTIDPADQARASRMIKVLNEEARGVIDQVFRKLKAGGDFAELAAKYSEHDSTKDKGGDLGMHPRQDLLPEFTQAITQMKVGETSEIIQTDVGFHIIKLTDKTPSQPLALKVVKTDILNHLLKIETEKLKQKYISELKKTADIKVFM